MKNSDPHEWQSQHVRSWLSWSTRQWKLRPPPDSSLFPEDGVSLCALRGIELKAAAGSPRAARLLRRHLKLLRHSATGRPLSPDSTDASDSDTDDQDISTTKGELYLLVNHINIVHNAVFDICTVNKYGFSNINQKLHMYVSIFFSFG